MKLNLLVIVTLLGATPTLARPFKAEEAHIRVATDTHITVRADYTYLHNARYCYALLDNSDQAMNYGTMVHRVDRGMTELRKLEAWTEIDGKKIMVPASNIHRGLAAASVEGFSDIDQYSFTYTAVQKGARLCYQTEEEIKPHLPGYFEALVSTPGALTEKGTRLQITSAVPLHVFKNDPKKNWQVTSSRKGKAYYYDIRVKNDYTEGTVFESESNDLLPDSPVVIFRSHQDIASEPFLKFRNEIAQRLGEASFPAADSQWLAKLKAEKLDVHHAAARVMAYVADRVRYMGDWRSREGKLVPRRLDTILSSGYGDCKDFSLLTIRMLRELGFKADFSLIRRGTLGTAANVGLEAAPLEIANHAVVYVSDGSGGFMIDPTNSVSLAAVLPDIMNRSALILGEQVHFVKTNSWQEAPSLLRSECSYELKSDLASLRCQQRYEGIDAAMTSMRYFRSHTKIVEEDIISGFTQKAKSYHFNKLPKFDEREVKTHDFDYEWTQDVDLLHTPAGYVVELQQPYRSIMDLKVDDRVTGILLPKERQEMRTTFAGLSPIHPTNALSCEVASDWFRIARKVSSTAQGVVVETRFETLKESIDARDFKSPSFIKLQKDYDACIRSQGMVLHKSKAIVKAS